MGKLKKWLTGKFPVVEEPTGVSTKSPTIGNEAFTAVCDARDGAWDSIGACDPDVLAPLINPAFTGGARWPGLRQAFRRITVTGEDGLAIMASDGLADPFDDGGPSTGLGAEVYLVSPAFFGVELHELHGLWQFSAIYCVAQTVAGNGFFLGPLLDTHGVVSLAVRPNDIPEDWQNDDGDLGVLFGVGLPGVPDAIAVGDDTVRLVGVVPLRPDELNMILTHGPNARSSIADALRGLSVMELSSPDRPSVLPLT